MDTRTELRIETLKNLVRQNSHTHNKEGVDKVGSIVQTLLSDLPLEWEITSSTSDDKGDLYLARSVEWDSSKPTVLLNGHLDTVFKKNWDINIKDNIFTGPGTVDMKAGVLSMIEIVKTLHNEGKLTNLMVLFTPDEEDGMHHIKKQTEYYKMADYALVFEEGVWDHSNPKSTDRAVVIRRKALSFYSIRLTSSGGHNATLTRADQRHSTIHQMAKIITRLEKLTDYKKGTLVNVGTIEGGISPNAIAEETSVRVDIRYGDSSEVERIQKALKEVLVSDDPKIEIEVVETLFYPSFDVNEKAISFADEVIEIGEKLGLKIRKQKRSSGSEANWISTANPDCIVLDGFGVIGGGDHSTEEYFFIDTLQHSIDLGSETVKHILNI